MSRIKRMAKTARGWICYRIVMAVPVNMDSRLYCWLLGWAGWYAHGGCSTPDRERA